MKHCFLLRIRQSNHGTEGIFIVENEKFFTLEQPWRANTRNLSCIPAGDYDVTIRISPKFGRVYWVLKVKDRSYILFHSGNFAGDTKKGLKTDTQGCILLGEKRGYLAGQRAVLLSRKAIRKFMTKLDGMDFKLHIVEVI